MITKIETPAVRLIKIQRFKINKLYLAIMKISHKILVKLM